MQINISLILLYLLYFDYVKGYVNGYKRIFYFSICQIQQVLQAIYFISNYFEYALENTHSTC